MPAVRLGAAHWAAPLVFMFYAGCGYVGPVLPPSPELPTAVTNLAAVERGDQLVITFTSPVRTTDNLVIKHFSKIDLGIGSAMTPFNFEQWSASARHYELPLPPPNDPDDPKPSAISKSLPAASWTGQRVAVLVRSAVKNNDHYSAWSNRIVLEVVPPIAAPVIQVAAVKEGYMLTWKEERSGLQYQIFRQGLNEKAPAEVGTADASPYVDTTAQWDTHYAYSVVAQEHSAESLPSEAVPIIHANTFPPSVPASMTALAGPDSIELSWSRSPDADLQGYYVYRSVDGGPFTRQGELTNLPTYSDRQVERGKTYKYAITAVSQKGYESEKSKIAEVVF